MEIAKDVLAVVYSDGTVMYMPPANLRFVIQALTFIVI